MNGGAFGSTLATSGTNRAATFPGLAFGATYQFRVRAQDSDGDWSAWVVSSRTVTPALVSDRSSAVTYRGSWVRYASTPSTNGGITSSAVAGSTAQYRFTGRTIAIVAPTNATRGRRQHLYRWRLQDDGRPADVERVLPPGRVCRQLVDNGQTLDRVAGRRYLGTADRLARRVHRPAVGAPSVAPRRRRAC